MITLEQNNNGAFIGLIKRSGRKPVQVVDLSQLTTEQTEQMFSLAEHKSTEEKPEIT